MRHSKAEMSIAKTALNTNIYYDYFNVQYDVSCYSSKSIHQNQLKHCPMVSWTSASLYMNDTIVTYNNPGI